jgi:hypothetical protein
MEQLAIQSLSGWRRPALDQQGFRSVGFSAFPKSQKEDVSWKKMFLFETFEKFWDRIGKLSWRNLLPLDQVPLANFLFQHFLGATCDVATDIWETITLYLIWMLMLCWPVTLVCANKIPSKIDTEFSQKFSHRRAKRGTRSVGFFTQGSLADIAQIDFGEQFPPWFWQLSPFLDALDDTAQSSRMRDHHTVHEGMPFNLCRITRSLFWVQHGSN